MPSARYELSSEAQDDLESLRIYITEQIGAPRAEGVLDRIERALDTLAAHGKGIVGTRIVDGRRDLQALFGD